MTHRIVSRSEWLEARKAHLEAEKAFTRQRDVLLDARRALPWVKVEENYVFEGPQGPVTLADLFDGRGQLMIQHFMFGPDWEEGCPSCSLMADHIDGARPHLAQAGLSFAAVARAPITRIEAFRRRLGWGFPWVSSLANDFNFDFNVSFKPEALDRGEAVYNYRTAQGDMEERQGVSVFCRDETGGIFHSYSAYARGVESFIGAFNLLDMVPKGRNEKSIMDWVRHHDRYEDQNFAAQPSAAE